MNEISYKIGTWYDQNKRDLPWRHTRDPYLIWLSETILQQTRVAQGYDYYLRFVEHYPTVNDLAAASEDEVLKLWQGLGYYSRARNLHAAAQQVVELIEQGEETGFPNRYEVLRQLKGVGPYTAAAVASLSSDQEVAVVDGNVYRVLSRLFDLDTPIDTGRGQKEFLALAIELLPHYVETSKYCKEEGWMRSGHHNQAMMELGALCCTPTSPQCTKCPVADHCLSLANGTQMLRPVKSSKVTVKERHLTYIIYIYRDTLWVHQRGPGDIWQGLWEPYLKQQDQAFPMEERTRQLVLQKKHQLTHQTIYADFWVCQLEEQSEVDQLNELIGKNGYRQVSWEEWQGLAVPRLIDELNRHLSSNWF